MWWKLLLLGLLTAFLVLAVQPFKTHAVKIEVPPNGQMPAQPSPSVLNWLSSMYVTPTSLAISALIIALAGYIAYRIVRG
jgi:hypothetical protein